jgi:hypothetical protein
MSDRKESKLKSLIKKHKIGINIKYIKDENNFFFWKELIQEYSDKKGICFIIEDEKILPKHLRNKCMKCIKDIIDEEINSLSALQLITEKSINDKLSLSTKLKASMIKSTKESFEKTIRQLKSHKVCEILQPSRYIDKITTRRAVECVERMIAMNINDLKLKDKIRIIQELETEIPKIEFKNMNKINIKPLYFQIYDIAISRFVKNGIVMKNINIITNKLNDLYFTLSQENYKLYNTIISEIKYISTLKYFQSFILETKYFTMLLTNNIALKTILTSSIKELYSFKSIFENNKGKWDEQIKFNSINEYVDYIINNSNPEYKDKYILFKRIKLYVNDKYPHVTDSELSNILTKYKKTNNIKEEKKEEKRNERKDERNYNRQIRQNYNFRTNYRGGNIIRNIIW